MARAKVAPDKDFASGKVRKEQIKRGTSKFGKAAGLAVVGTAVFGAAAQAFNRASGTPAYGEQGVTPAMLTPGEFVVNSKSAQKYGSQLQAMNAGGQIEFRQDPTGPGYDPNNDFLWGDPNDQTTQPKKSRFRQVTTKFGPNMERAAKITASATEKAAKITAKAIVQGAKVGADKFDKSRTGQNAAKWMGGQSVAEIKLENQLEKQTKQLLAQGKTSDQIHEIQKDRKVLLEQIRAGDKEAIKTFKAQTKEQKMAKKQQTAGTIGKASNIGFAVSGAAMAYGMLSSEGAAGKDMANSVSQIGFMVSGLLMMLPMFMSLTGGIILGLGTLVGSFFLYNNMIKSAAREGSKTAQALGVTADELQKISQITGNTSSTMLAERQRESRVKNYNPIRSEFGPGFIESEAGQDLIKLAEQFEKKGIDSAKVIANKLSAYVIDGLMTAADAESVAEALGRSIDDRTYGLEVLGNVQDLIGVNGRSLLNHPIQIRVDLIEDIESTGKDYIVSLQEELDKYNKGIDVKEKIGPDIPVLDRFLAKLPGFNIVGRKKKESEISGAISGQQIMELGMSQQIIDSAQIEYDTKKKQVEEEELLLQTRLKTTTDSKIRLEIEKKLLDISKKRSGIEEVYGSGIQNLVDRQKQMLVDTVVTFNQLDKKVQENLLITGETSLRDKFKGTLNAPNAEKVIELGKELSPDLNYKINLLVGSDQLDVGNAKRLLEAFQGDELALDARFELMVDKNGLESVNRTMTALSSIKDPEATKRLFTSIGGLAKEDYDDANVFLENAIGIPDAFMDLNDNTKNLLSGEAMAEAGKDIKKIETDLKDLNKLSKEDRQVKILDFISDDSDFDALQGQAEYFAGLDDSSVKTFLTVFRSITEDYDPEQALSEYNKANPMAYQYGTPSDAALEKWWLTNVAVPRAKRFVEIMKEIKLPGLDKEDIKEGGGKSLPISTKQLIELRLKGLDPAAASQLDFDSAARILNGSVKQQKEVIARLNAELRDAAIQSQLLMTDQEVLESQMDSTSNAIGAYISALQQTDIKTVQDQIDKYDELTKTQQEQLEKYQKGLEKLSDKEKNINEVYNDRISAIDKVTQANDRALQRQQNQIDLASAIASGDFGAAAGAAANISNTEAQAQLEDARTSLEQQRQSELKALTIEVNGQLYTREQIETNINTIDEEIYQRSLLIRAEQQKIADIEKVITAEKEKQRKLQVLSQISQLSSQIAATVDQTQRQAMSAQIGYLGQSIGLDMRSPESITKLSNELGINAQSLVDSLGRSQKIASMTADEFNKSFVEVTNKLGKNGLSGFIDKTSLAGMNSLQFMTGLKDAWAGDSKKGISGLVSTGVTIKDTLIGAGAAIVAGKKALDDALAAANIALANARAAANTPAKTKFNPKTGKWETAAFGGVMRYMGGGKVNKYAMGGNVNYKGSTEQAPVRMSIGNLVPGLGNTDRVPALLTPGEFVVRKSVTKQNLGLLKSLNGDVFPQMSGGIGANAVMVPITNTNMEGSTTLYNNNYSVNVNVGGTNSTADEVANVVIRKIKGMNDRGIRGNRY